MKIFGPILFWFGIQSLPCWLAMLTNDQCWTSSNVSVPFRRRRLTTWTTLPKSRLSIWYCWMRFFLWFSNTVKTKQNFFMMNSWQTQLSVSSAIRCFLCPLERLRFCCSNRRCVCFLEPKPLDPLTYDHGALYAWCGGVNVVVMKTIFILKLI